ncbi:MAG: DUF4399 domain-containing protein [SAR324 cluster bacterium]|nr:DUF4399 domain-containing protein [SAR324 cluster bacterium]
MLNSSFNIQNLFLLFFITFFIPLSTSVYGGETPSVPGTKVYFINLIEGQKIKSPYLVQLGLTSEMGIAPALADWPDTGHHHIIIDSTITNMNKSISNKHVHLGKGQTEILLKLASGKHTIQIFFGDYSHIPHDPPVMSEILNITVE